MTAALLATGAGEESRGRKPLELRFEDSLQSLAVPIRRVSATMGGVLVGSLALHVLLLAAAIVTSRVPVAAPHQEIAVDIVQEMPKPAKPETKKPDAKKPEAAKSAPAKAEPVKAEPAKVEQAKVEQAKLEPPEPEPPKAAPAKPAKAPPQKAAQPAPQKPEVAKAEPPKPTPAAKPAAGPQEIDKLEQELAALRAQQASLQAEAAALSKQKPASQGAGSLAKSLQAIALPSVGTGDGEVAGYQEIVFSQLAKAKGDGEWQGPGGTTGVRFQVDAAGHLLSAEVAVTSGSALLDKEALDIVHRAAPFPPPPKDADHSFYANVNFLPPKHS